MYDNANLQIYLCSLTFNLHLPGGNPNLVISGSNDRTARLWDIRLHTNHGFVRKLKSHQKAVRRLQFDDYKLQSN